MLWLSCVCRMLPQTLVLDHVSPATRLLEKRRQMFEVQEALEHQKQEFNRKVRVREFFDCECSSSTAPAAALKATSVSSRPQLLATSMLPVIKTCACAVAFCISMMTSVMHHKTAFHLANVPTRPPMHPSHAPMHPCRRKCSKEGRSLSN